MNTHFTWEVSRVRKYENVGSHNDIVYQLFWRCTGITTVGSNTKTATINGWVGLDTSVSNPISYNSIDSSTAIGWAQSALTEVGVNGYKNQICDILNDNDSFYEEETSPPWN